jgi:glycosyltransferase involved in cell wall biosynthesis
VPRVLVAGTFDYDARSRVIISALRLSGFELEVINEPLWGPQRYVLVDQPKLALALKAARTYARLLLRLLRAQRADVLVVLYPGHLDMPLVAAVARLRRVPVLFDMFLSVEDTLVADRSFRQPDSMFARFTRIVDRVASRCATIILTDTPEDADHFAELTGVPRTRFRVLWVGAPDDVFHPLPETSPIPNLVLFYGTYIPLHGAETIIRAAKLLEADDIRFVLIGDGQERPKAERLVKELASGNVELSGLVQLEQLPMQIASAALCLGIFGTTPKAARVVPHKVFQCLAVGRPVLTADTPAIRSAFDAEVATVRAGDAPALAIAIRELLGDTERLESLASAGHARYERDYSEPALGRQLTSIVDELTVDRTADKARP